jgi:YesN/AraC family two-component response regulator
MNITAFIVDDEVWIRRGLIRKIEKLDLGVTIIGEAGNGIEALHRLKTCQPDLLITDIKMPVMDGIELMQSVRSLYPQIKLIILSGYAEFETARQAISLGVSAYILKPVKDSSLSDVLTQVGREIAVQTSSLVGPDTPANQTAATRTENGVLNPVEGQPHKLVQAVVADICQNSHLDLSLQDYADRHFVNAAYLSRSFKAETGKTLTDTINTLRVDKARQLLRNTGFNASTIARQVGFEDPRYFYRVFKNLTGLTPSAYRAGPDLPPDPQT